jgi:3-phenylpropionate/trans-cinnamate dioxygenase ferredoxin reductase component
VNPGSTVVVVGAGLAGLRTAEELRHLGHVGPLVLVGSELHPPYDRPPLSKAVLSADLPTFPWLREEAELATLDVDLRLSRTAVGLDAAVRSVRLDDGTSLTYDSLVLACGAIPRQLPRTPPRPGLHLLRTVNDAHRLAREIRDHRHLVVVGGGFIGCEVAATARSMGAEVVLVEALAAPLLQAAGPEVGAEVLRLHQEAGVRVVCDTLVTAVVGDEQVQGVVLSSGEHLPARSVVVGLGVTPATDWLAGSGLEIDDGVRCDAAGRTSLPGVYAVGDVAHWAPPRPELAGRHEHWTSAVDQARVVARNILDPSAEPVATLTDVPYFWSDLYGLKIQALGWPGGDRETRTFRAGRAGDRLVVLYELDGVLVGVLGFGVPRVVMSARGLLERRVGLDEAAGALGLDGSPAAPVVGPAGS